MRKTSIHTVDLITMLLGEVDTGSGAPSALPGHVQDRIASMGGADSTRRRFPRRRVT